MHKYCPVNCFTPEGEKGHLDAAKSNLNSAKNAVKALEGKREGTYSHTLYMAILYLPTYRMNQHEYNYQISPRVHPTYRGTCLLQ